MKLEVRPNSGIVALAVVGALLSVAQASRAQPAQATDVPVRGVVEDVEDVYVPVPAGQPSPQAKAYSPYAGRKYPTRVLWGEGNSDVAFHDNEIVMINAGVMYRFGAR